MNGFCVFACLRACLFCICFLGCGRNPPTSNRSFGAQTRREPLRPERNSFSVVFLAFLHRGALHFRRWCQPGQNAQCPRFSAPVRRPALAKLNVAMWGASTTHQPTKAQIVLECPIPLLRSKYCPLSGNINSSVQVCYVQAWSVQV